MAIPEAMPSETIPAGMAIRAGAADNAAPAPPASSDATLRDPFEIVEPHQAGAYAFVVRVRATGRLYRITPARDPREPRFWCVVVYRCTASGLPDAAERPWVGGNGMRREELRDTMAAIRADVNGWLTTTDCQDFRRWFLAPADPAAPVARGKAKP